MTHYHAQRPQLSQLPRSRQLKQIYQGEETKTTNSTASGCIRAPPEDLNYRRLAQHPTKRGRGVEYQEIRKSICLSHLRIDELLKDRSCEGGHCFATKADVRKLACDAWLLPTNLEKVVLPMWTEGQDGILAEIAENDFSSYEFPDQWGPTARAATPKLCGSSDGPMPILTILGGEKGVEEQDTLEWYVGAIDHFVHAWLVNRVRHLPSRSKPLLAVPLVGTVADVFDRTVLLLELTAARCGELALKNNVDVVVAVKDSRFFALFQHLRREADLCWPSLQGERREVAQEIAAKVRRSELALFLGAGVSMGAGLPSWGQLLNQLCERAGITKEKEAMLQELDYTDYAQILKEELEIKGLDIYAEIAKMTTSSTYALTHALLATWQIANAVTQNYDTMYEQASADSSGEEVAVIPYKSCSCSKRWLLKMHGCVEFPEDIVLTREDYRNYKIRREALSGVVQALMMTKHMLILGFSMTDEHFIDLAFPVRKTMAGMERGETLGTVVTLLPEKIRSQLWRNHLAFFAASTDENASYADAARDLAVFLDFIGAFSNTNFQFWFDSQMDPLLDAQSIALRDRLLTSVKSVLAKGDGDSPIVQDFIDVLVNKYGCDPEDLRS